MKFIFRSLLLLLLGYLAVHLVNKYFSLKDDNIVEEAIEEIIKEEIGLSVDLTPKTNE